MLDSWPEENIKVMEYASRHMWAPQTKTRVFPSVFPCALGRYEIWALWDHSNPNGRTPKVCVLDCCMRSWSPQKKHFSPGKISATKMAPKLTWLKKKQDVPVFLRQLWGMQWVSWLIFSWIKTKEDTESWAVRADFMFVCDVFQLQKASGIWGCSYEGFVPEISFSVKAQPLHI